MSEVNESPRRGTSRNDSAPAAAPGAVHSRKIGYIPEFDGIRGIALLIVLISHTAALYRADRWSAIPGGFLALDMFFVLSGFLITAMLLRDPAQSGTINLAAFYKRRVLRLFPALVAVLAAHWCYSILTDLPQELERATLLAVAFYYLNWKVAFGQEIVPALGHLWSLSVEEQFYLVWPFVTASLLHVRRRLGIVVIILLAAIAYVAIARGIMLESGMKWSRLYVRTDTRAEGLLTGALLAHLWVRGLAPARMVVPIAWVMSAFLAWCLVFVQPQDAELYVGLFTAIAFAWGVIMLAILETAWSLKALLRLSVLRVLGRVSYGCYLWHFPIYVAVRRHTPDWSPAWRIALAFSLTALATYLSWILIERHFLARKGGPRRREPDLQPPRTPSQPVPLA